MTAYIGKFAIYSYLLNSAKASSSKEKQCLYNTRVLPESHHAFQAASSKYKITLAYKVLFIKSGKYLLCNSLIEALLYFYKTDDGIKKPIMDYVSKMYPSDNYASIESCTSSRYQILTRLCSEINKFPFNYKYQTSLATISLIFDCDVIPVAFDKNYTLKDSLFQFKNNLIVDCGEDSRYDIAFFSSIASLIVLPSSMTQPKEDNPIESAKIVAQEKYTELKNKTSAISSNVDLSKKLNSLADERIELISEAISNKVKEYLSQAISVLIKDLVSSSVGYAESSVERNVDSIIKDKLDAVSKILMK